MQTWGKSISKPHKFRPKHPSPVFVFGNVFDFLLLRSKFYKTFYKTKGFLRRRKSTLPRRNKSVPRYPHTLYLRIELMHATFEARSQERRVYEIVLFQVAHVCSIV